MTREELIKACKYYKGERVCPQDTDPMMWNYEQIWVDFTLNEPQYIKQIYREYIDMMGDNYNEDETPDTLKAVLFNRYTHWNTYWTPREFIGWYKSEYLKVH